MSIPDNETKHITKLYDSVLQYYFSQDQRKILDFEDRPFYNLVECLYGLMKSDPFFSTDLLCDSINCELEKTTSLPGNTTEKETLSLINNIYSTFDINKQKHYILIPLQGSKLKNDCCFGQFHLVSINKKDRKQIFQRISETTNIGYTEVKQSLEHTERSRSKDFLNANILIITVEDQTDNVRRSAFDMQIRPTAFTIGLIIYSFIALFFVYTEFGIDSFRCYIF